MEQLHEGPQKTTLHMKKIMKIFCKHAEEDIEIATATALQEWCRQEVEFQLLRTDKANQDLKGPRFWKLDKVKVEVVQANLKMDFQRIAIKHHEEVTKLMAKQRDYLEQLTHELLMVGEPMPTVPTHGEENILNILEDDDDPAEPS